MIINIQGNDTYCYTGGKPFDPNLPTAVFIHGGLNDHSVWALQSRYFAHHGFGVLALDLPGHGRSLGAPLTTIEEMSDWMLELLSATGVTKVVLIGHSMGSLIALESASRSYYPVSVRGIALLATAYPMKVSDELLHTVSNDQATAIAMVNKWSHGGFVHKPSSPGPGFDVLGCSKRLMERLAQQDRQNPAKLKRASSVFHSDFTACNIYKNGASAALAIRCPTLFLLGKRDVMTPPRASPALASVIAHAKVTLVDSGHAMMAEQPDTVLTHLFEFAKDIT
ncbi:alpha/beta fold hydrolase [Glaciimonas immobilis]|uniref:Pimeloyl-ACP methyl ester carboxylesterase n=1 Tax=Glaciimonas immobilis TaxID=728004 RepID=A0A840RQI9_9BURK|nr:alpha/beta hydrolase [Glaciimonas immobilis]KAF3997924.1 alpha/beta hydrolase [Glaciimonas immobilis]MBB5199412.1 pimeloyl-ACP methyl ester carboxylesterase [Glaciimonas immobilis]